MKKSISQNSIPILSKKKNPTTISNLGIEGNYLSLIKNICKKKTMVSITLNGEGVNAFPVR